MDNRAITKNIDVDKILLGYFESDLIMLFSLGSVSKLHRVICREKYRELFKIFSDFIAKHNISKLKKLKKYKQKSLISMCKQSITNGNLCLVKWMIKHNYCPDFYKLHAPKNMDFKLCFEKYFVKYQTYEIFEIFFQFTGISTTLSYNNVSTLKLLPFVKKTWNVSHNSISLGRKSYQHRYKLELLTDFLRQAIVTGNDTLIKILECIICPEEKSQFLDIKRKLIDRHRFEIYMYMDTY